MTDFHNILRTSHQNLPSVLRSLEKNTSFSIV